ncbi:hypothetical protein BDZ94DRAFT_1307345 [Collybia nuda]|uniref:Uncharacterized protein n=1 Tax=Collybia nuda TaxID=64659 RepID=A0A9P5YC85_9AGAR|nr:hypothetical protein BDZ94DRAFT_1307345 [Collybia nuda]
MTTRSPYNGPYRKLLLAFDVGTTYSGVSYSILDPGQIPEIKGVTRFPAQGRVGGDSKIPTVVYYNQNGELQAAGAEASDEGVQEKADSGGWTKAEWFKLHLRPKTTSSSGITHSLPALPENKAAIDIFVDFLQYLYACTKIYIQDTHANGVTLWNSVENLGRIEFVLSHPNGWEGAQQAQMRTAAVRAGLIPDTTAGHERVRFVTEGEASLHFCIQSGLMTDDMKKGNGVLIVDAGGGTVDISAYAPSASSRGFSFAETAPPQCHFQGSIFVTSRARTFLQSLLRGSKFSDDVDNITSCFDKTTKLTFRNMSEPQFVRFGSARDKDPKVNIRLGQLRLLGYDPDWLSPARLKHSIDILDSKDLATFFEPSISSIVQAISEQQKCARKPISSVFLVGGFAASDWLFTELKDSLKPMGLTLCRPDSHVGKAVADGAVSFYLDHFVSSRVSKFSYGARCFRVYDPKNKEHVQRSSSAYVGIDGKKHIPNGFEVILDKNTQVSETKEFTKSYFILSSDRSALKRLSIPVLCYRGPGIPKWLDVNPELYSTLCHVEADTTALSMTLTTQKKPNSRQIYYQLDYQVILSFGLTELKAQICWKAKGKEKRGPAIIVYEPDVAIHDIAKAVK